jgi:hypothetical protein
VSTAASDCRFSHISDQPFRATGTAGFEGKTPVTPDEFAAAWRLSEDHACLLRDIEEFDKQYPLGGSSLDVFKNARRAVQARSQYVEALDPERVL